MWPKWAAIVMPGASPDLEKGLARAWYSNGGTNDHGCALLVKRCGRVVDGPALRIT